VTRGVPQWLHLQPEVAQALLDGQPIVALESTVITHGLPKPINLDLARSMEGVIRDSGAIPATVALFRGEIRMGLSPDELERLSLAEGSIKVSRRDLGAAVSKGLSGGTTVAATMYIAHAAGVSVFATGGIGGVHRGTSGDISADLPELARTPVAVVCAGAKSILDLPRTLEWLETAGIPVMGFGTDTFPAFFSRESDLPVSVRVDTVGEAANLIRTHWRIGLESGLLLCVPCPEETALTSREVERSLKEAEEKAQAQGVTGKELTPFLLTRLSELTKGGTLQANLALLKNNARVAAGIAKALV
jgi:pseudouridine-5'-phosphate glycosidase